MEDVQEHVDIIREVFRYSQAFAGRTFVFQLDDAVVLHAAFSSLVRDLGLLHQAGIRVGIVAGARHRIDEILARYNVVCEKKDGVRISTAEAMPFIKMAAFDTANRVMTSLSGIGINAVIGNWVRARSLGVVGGVDFQDAGSVDRIRVDLLRGVIEQRSIPILPCIGWSASGRPYNVSSRELAMTLAMAIGAAKLFFVTEFEGLTRSRYTLPREVEATPGGRISRLSVTQAASFLEKNDVKDDDGIELLKRAYRAASGGVERVHIVGGLSDGAVLREIFSNLGVGTMVHANEYQSIRPMRRDEAPDVLRLMRPLIASGLLVARTERDVAERFEDYVVFETDEIIHGCGALHTFGDRGEIAAMAVDRNYDQIGIGSRIVGYLIEVARRRGLSVVFALTTQASDWFEQLGFRPGTVADLPPSRREHYDPERKSRILTFAL